jgi:hypothetical protein
METRVNEDRLTQGPSEPASVTPIGVAAGAAEGKKHFDPFETHFFQQGDEASYSGGEEVYDESLYARDGRRLLSYRAMVGLTIASCSLAIAACVALFRSNAPSLISAEAVAARPAPARMPPTPVVAAPVATPVSAGLVPPAAESPPVPGPAPTASAVLPPALAAGSPALPAAPSAEGTPALAKAEPTKAEPTKAEATKAEATKVEATRPETAKAEGAKVEGASPDEPEVAAAAPPRESEARERCRQSVREKRAREIVTVCSAAFAEDTTDADAAVAVAKIEFDRGRFAQAYAWSKKAIAVNPAAADAYVFAGGAEQYQGHGKAAKEAYLHYLRLAPSGRYAAELRTIVNSL